MTRDDIIRMASKAGFRMRGDGWFDGGFHNEKFEHFAALVAAAEREKFTVHAAALVRDARQDAAEREREAILSHVTKAHDVDGNCDIVLAADIRTRGKK